MSNVIFEISGLTKEFGSLAAVSNVSTQIKRGEAVFVVGPSGSGKSTFLRCLNLLETPTSGTIRFKDQVITDDSLNINRYRKHVGMVFQHFNLFPNLTIRKISPSHPLRLEE